MMNTKFLYTGIVMMSAGAVGIVVSICFEAATGEPVYWLIMKLTAGLFGVGGGLLALASRKRR